MSEYRTTITYKDVILAETLEGAEAKALDFDIDLAERGYRQVDIEIEPVRAIGGRQWQISVMARKWADE